MSTRSFEMARTFLARFGLGLLLLGMTPALLLAEEVVPIGPEFQVNTYTTRMGYYPHGKVAADAAGNFVVVWPSYEPESDKPGLFGERFSSAGERLGAEFQVNTDSYVYQEAYNNAIQSVVSDPAGNFVVVWGGYREYCYKCIFGQRFDSSANPIGGEFQVNSPDPYEDYNNNPEIAMDGAGNFIVAWENKDASPEGVAARRFDSSGNPLGEHFVVNTYTTGYQGDHGWVAVAAAPAGNFLVVWVDEYQDDWAQNVFGQHYDSAGSPQGGEFRVNTNTPGWAEDPAVAADGAGNFVVVWASARGDGYGDFGIRGQRFDSAGALGGEFQVNTYTTGDQGDSRGQSLSVACEPAGDFVVVWDGQGEGDSWGIFGQRFDSSGNPMGGEFQVNTYTPYYQRYPSVTSTGPGAFVVVWTSYEWVTNEYNTIFGQRFTLAEAQDLLLTGKRLLIKNKVPDDKEKNKSVWLVKDSSIVAGTRETPDDPRCNGAPAGTVKAIIRFFSDDSGHDTGTIALPCENWSPLGPDVYPNATSLGYKYRDRELDQGPCKLLMLRGGRLLKATCYGKGETTDFPYDLVQGTSEGTVHVVLQIGLIKYCTAFGPSGGKDGSDGKKFKGTNSPAPPSCPGIPDPICGDGVIEGEEECEDGNTADGDCCSSSCQFDPAGAACDDGEFCTAVDECDGGGVCNGSGSRCGDGNVDAECGEECDGAGETETCDIDCTAAICGDSRINATAGEECEDGNTVDGDCCSSTCQLDPAGAACDDGEFCTAVDECNGSGSCIGSGSRCGDGNVDAQCGEECDGAGESETCNADCTTAFCGDLKINGTAGEECDDGGQVDGDGCSSICLCNPATTPAVCDLSGFWMDPGFYGGISVTVIEDTGGHSSFSGMWDGAELSGESSRSDSCGTGTLTVMSPLGPMTMNVRSMVHDSCNEITGVMEDPFFGNFLFILVRVP